MFRRKLRKFPILYRFIRMLHILIDNVVSFPKRIGLGIKYSKILNTIDIECFSFNIWFLCVPEHNNLGDRAQYYCIKDWIEKNYPNANLIEIPSEPLHFDYCKIRRILSQLIKEDDMIVFQSGYTSTDLHIDEKVHQKIVRIFKKNKIVFFPQTVRYSSPRMRLKTANIYNKHNRLIFMARDQVSYDIAAESFISAEVYLIPDIVTSLIGSKRYAYSRSGILFCIRHDSEKMYSDIDIKNAFINVDISSELKNSEWTDTTLGKDKTCDRNAIEECINCFAKYKLVITDRFHGTIFSLIAGTPVIVLKTSDYKVTEGANWFIDLYPDYIRKADTIKQACSFAKEMLNHNYDFNLQPYLKEKYFDRIKDLIEER